MAASLRRVGRKTKTRAYDALIAATAMAHDLPRYTCNPDDFAGIDGLDIVPVPIPGAAAPHDAAGEPDEVSAEESTQASGDTGREPA